MNIFLSRRLKLYFIHGFCSPTHTGPHMSHITPARRRLMARFEVQSLNFCFVRGLF